MSPRVQFVLLALLVAFGISAAAFGVGLLVARCEIANRFDFLGHTYVCYRLSR